MPDTEAGYRQGAKDSAERTTHERNDLWCGPHLSLWLGIYNILVRTRKQKTIKNKFMYDIRWQSINKYKGEKQDGAVKKKVQMPYLVLKCAVKISCGLKRRFSD